MRLLVEEAPGTLSLFSSKRTQKILIKIAVVLQIRAKTSTTTSQLKEKATNFDDCEKNSSYYEVT